MLIDLDNQKLQDTFNAFYQLTGINVNLVDTEFSFYDCNPTVHNGYCQKIQCSKEGRKMCGESDCHLLCRCRNSKMPEHHICYGGLMDIAVPILYEGEILGYIIMGQLKVGDYFSRATKTLADLGLNIRQMDAEYKNLPLTPPEKIQSLITIVTMLAEHILMKDMMKPSMNEGLKRAVDYIQEHLDCKLTISEITRKTNLSKSLIYRNFHRYFQCTVNEYINRERIERAVPLLTQTDLSIEEISRRVGFSNASYFGRIFKNIKGRSPREFRN